MSRFFAYQSKKPGDAVNQEEIDIFTHNLSKTYEEWQVNQAREAIRLYLFFSSKAPQKHSHGKKDSKERIRMMTEEIAHLID